MDKCVQGALVERLLLVQLLFYMSLVGLAFLFEFCSDSFELVCRDISFFA